ncbi:carbon monoxide dehydrogenase subunit G [Oscillochloris trichoides DG-6]|uniref:Carbon monoxide dehydrogenase subunit G n=1 Tax=Oscillochloris trichoides DG-6 TaxID=765420 RepID=E1I9X4_9CHLR|nr:carbon monoxide dehydrogenase subunit G [Oscillochloris trichoides]EFO81976.1 carbon monoxide dehydrogenase subunit G [Oscillochloris trichoides DG-6]
MRIAGNYTFEATREEVWAALNDPEVLARTIPGCQQLDQVGPNEYETTLKIGLQAVRGVYSGRVKIDDVVVPESYTVHVDGKGNNGFLKGHGVIKLRVEGQTTILDYGGEAQIGGTIASVGQRLIDGAARTLIHQSLKALATQIETRRLPVAPEPEPVAPEPEPVAPDPVPAAPPQIERRTIVVPAHEQLSEVDVARGMLVDFFAQRPWLGWVVAAFLLGYLFGTRRSS